MSNGFQQMMDDLDVVTSGNVLNKVYKMSVRVYLPFGEKWVILEPQMTHILFESCVSAKNAWDITCYNSRSTVILTFDQCVSHIVIGNTKFGKMINQGLVPEVVGKIFEGCRKISDGKYEIVFIECKDEE